MRWQGRRQSTNVDDRRSSSSGKAVAGGGIIGIIVLLFYLFTGDAPPELPVDLSGAGGSAVELTPEQQAEDEKRAEFVKVVLAETEDVWNEIFQRSGQDYPEPTLVLFRNVVQSGCGSASAQSGPFYCPGDHQIYIDLSFYEDLQNKFNAPGEFAMAYVLAHEVGHHIQTILGTSAKLQEARQRLSTTEYNKLSVRMELQADFLAGVWAHYTQKMKNIIEPGDIEAALNAANAIGDDRLQEKFQGRVVPDAFTHGTSEQRMYWFKKGYETGDLSQGDTFNTNYMVE